MGGNGSLSERMEKLDLVLGRIMQEWYERCRHSYVTAEDSSELGVEPEVKYFKRFANHRLKFSRKGELEVTYGLAAEHRDGRILIVASVNNKSERFDYDGFVRRLQDYYWRAAIERPWTRPAVDRYTYADLLFFEPRIGGSITLDVREEHADIVRLAFQVRPGQEEFLLGSEELLHDLIENYCLNPLKRIYAESYRQS
jgi:hypothetical protein